MFLRSINNGLVGVQVTEAEAAVLAVACRAVVAATTAGAGFDGPRDQLAQLAEYWELLAGLAGGSSRGKAARRSGSRRRRGARIA